MQRVSGSVDARASIDARKRGVFGCAKVWWDVGQTTAAVEIVKRGPSRKEFLLVSSSCIPSDVNFASQHGTRNGSVAHFIRDSRSI